MWVSLTPYFILPSLTLGANLLEVLKMSNFSAFASLAERTHLVHALTSTSEPHPLTVFAPPDEAFAAIPKNVVDVLLSDRDLLARILSYHIVTSRLSSFDFSDDALVNTLEGTPLRINVYLQSDFYEGFVTANGRRVSRGDLKADNGLVHEVADIIHPIPWGNVVEVMNNDTKSRFTKFVFAIEEAGLVKTLAAPGPYTVYAPTDEAFERMSKEDREALFSDKKALKRAVLRLVVPGTFFWRGTSWMVHDAIGGERLATQVFKSGLIKVATSMNKTATITIRDLVATNGVVQAIDTFI